MKKNTYTRYHRYDQYGTKYIKRFENGCPPTNLPEEVMKVWENVKSPNFQMPVRSIVNQIEI